MSNVTRKNIAVKTSNTEHKMKLISELIMKQIVIILTVFLVSTIGIGQDRTTYLKVQPKLGVGFGGHFLDYTDLEGFDNVIRYSHGGGIGLEIGGGIKLREQLYFEVGALLDQLLAIQYESINGFSNRTSASMTKLHLTPSIKYNVPMTKKFEMGFLFGVSPVISGPLKRVENSVVLPEIEYKTTGVAVLGVQAEILFKKLDLFGGFRIRVGSYASQSANVPARLRNPSASSFDLTAGIRI